MLEIGVFSVDITPPVGIPLVGFANRDVSTGVLDSLTATALVARSGSAWVAFVDCDLLYVSEETTARVRKMVAEGVGIPEDHLALLGTHTHFGPDVCWNIVDPMCSAYLPNLEYALAGAVLVAANRLTPVRAGIGWGTSDIGINRRERIDDGRVILGRNPEGAIDRDVGVCRFESPSGAPVATVVNFQAHPVSLTGAWREVSACFPGETRRVVSRLTAAPCLFVQGACGDINPAVMGASPGVPRSLGTRLGCEVVKVWEGIEIAETDGVSALSRLAELPRFIQPTRAAAEAKAEHLESERERLINEGALPGMVNWMERRIARQRLSVAAWDGDENARRIPAEFQALRVGPLAIATAPGEIFNELGAEVKRSGPREATFFASNANGAVGYVPVRGAYGDGGYEVDDACQVAPEAGDILVETCGALLGEVTVS